MIIYTDDYLNTNKQQVASKQGTVYLFSTTKCLIQLWTKYTVSNHSRRTSRTRNSRKRSVDVITNNNNNNNNNNNRGEPSKKRRRFSIL